MKKSALLLFFIAVSGFMAGQGFSYVFQPDSACGKDAYLSSLIPDHNYGSHPDFLATAWTNAGVPCVARGLLQFDLGGIPTSATVLDARLELFHYNSTANVGHSNLSGPDDATLYRVTAPWSEHAVTWNTQPTWIATNSVFIPAAASATQNYTINVTALVQNMISDPLHNYGFLFKENVESHYRSMLFASSDESNLLLHPKLTVTLASPVSLVATCLSYSYTPASPPANDTVPTSLSIPNVFTPNGDGQNDTYFITSIGYSDYRMTIYNRWGLLLETLTPQHPAWNGSTADGNKCPDGVYYYLLDLWTPSGKQRFERGYVTVIGGKF